MAEYVEAAIEIGLDELGISDHFVYPRPGRPVRWSMPLERLPAYFDGLREARELAGDKIKVRFGLEADYEPQTIDALAELLVGFPLDYVIGSIHFLDLFPVDDSPGHWDKLSEPERNDTMRAYWNQLARMAKRGVFSFVGHIDICRKFGHLPTVDLSADIAAALDAIAQAGMAVEINTSGRHCPIQEAYPSPAILVECRRRGIPILINADAHAAASLTSGFEEAAELASSAGYTETLVYEARQARVVPITRLL